MNWQELHSRGLGSGGAGTPKEVSQEWEEGVRASGRGRAGIQDGETGEVGSMKAGQGLRPRMRVLPG